MSPWPRAAPEQPAPVAAGPVPIGPSADPAFDAELEALLRNAANDAVDIEAPGTTLADVGGLDDVKRQIELSFLAPMRNPELRQMYGKSLRGGLLLYGPPGCGKTFLARAIAGELDAGFYAIGLHEVLDMWLGQSEQNLHEVFERARANTPCVLFLDEVDALGQKRSQLTHSAGRNVVVQLLSELDGMGADNEGIFVLAATNQPWDVDPALRRPGRLDRTILVVPPDEDARRKILEVHLRDKPVDGIDFRRIAARTDGYSGADLRLVCEAAAELAIEDSLRQGRPRPIGQDDVVAALGASDAEHALVVRDGAQRRRVRERRGRVRRPEVVHAQAPAAVSDTDAIERRVHALLELGRVDDAIHELTPAIASDPTNATLLVMLSEALLRAGRPAEAERAARDAITRAPQWASSYRGPRPRARRPR